MRTSLTRTEELENLLLKKGDPGDRLLLEAKLYLDPELASEAYWQDRTYRLIRLHGRQLLRKELKDLQQKLFSDPIHRDFREKVLSFFKH